MRAILFLIALGLLLAAGCMQMLEQTTGELSSCMEKCSSMCELAKENNLSQGDFAFNSITLTKQSGATKIYCSCPCAA